MKDVFVVLAYSYFAMLLLKNDFRIRVPFKALIFIGLQALFLATLVISGFWSNFSGAFFSELVNELVYLPFFIALVTFFFRLPDYDISELKWAARFLILSILLFFGYNSIINGLNLITIFKAYLAGGQSVQYVFFNKIFSSIDADAGSNARHTMAYVLFIAAAYIAAARAAIQSRTQAFGNGFTLEELVIVLLIVVVAMSRKVALAVALFYLLHWVYHYRHGASSSKLFLPKLFFGVGVLIVSTLYVFSIDGVASVLERKYIDDIANNPRVEQFVLTIDELRDAPSSWLLTGMGYGNMVASEFYAHNSFLNALHQGGLLSFSAVTALSIYLLYLFLKQVYFCLGDRYQANIFTAFVCVACWVVAMTKMQTGVKGELSFIGYFALSIMFGLMGRTKNSEQYDRNV